MIIPINPILIWDVREVDIIKGILTSKHKEEILICILFMDHRLKGLFKPTLISQGKHAFVQ